MLRSHPVEMNRRVREREILKYPMPLYLTR